MCLWIPDLYLEETFRHAIHLLNLRKWRAISSCGASSEGEERTVCSLPLSLGSSKALLRAKGETVVMVDGDQAVLSATRDDSAVLAALPPALTITTRSICPLTLLEHQSYNKSSQNQRAYAEVIKSSLLARRSWIQVARQPPRLHPNTCRFKYAFRALPSSVRGTKGTAFQYVQRPDELFW